MDYPEEVLKSYRDHLSLCEYPNISKMDFFDIQKILSRENRIDFLIWALVKLVPEYEYKLEASKMTKKLENTIAELVFSNGFCKNSEKNNFVKGNLKMDQEIGIFNRIIKTLGGLYTDFDKENLSTEISGLKYLLQHPSKEHFEDRILCNGNIFGSNVKKMTEKDLSEKYENLKKNIEEINIEIEEAEQEKEEVLKTIEDVGEIRNISKEEIENLLSKLVETTSIFGRDFSEYANNFSKLPTVASSSTVGPILEATSQNLDYMLKVLESENYMKNNKEIETVEEREGSTSENYTDFIVNNYVISEEILDETDLNKSFDSVI